MSVPEASLNQFLEQARGFALARLAGQTSYHGNADQPLFLVMGNGAGDADSLTSAISLSYLLSTYSHEKLPLKAPLPSNAVYVPLIQTNRSDSHLRPENEAILAAAGIKQEQILYLSDLTDSKAQRGLGLNLARAGVLSPSKGTYLGLVDHPQLEVPWLPTDSDQGGSDPGSERQVKLLVDHHADSGRHQDALLRVFRQPEGTDAANPTGSAQSIVVDLFSEAIKGNSAVFPQNLANMAISTVLIDTDNMRPPPRGRASATDFGAVELLLPISSLSTSSAAEQFQAKLLQNSPQEVQDSQRESAASTNFSILLESPTSSSLAEKTASIADILAANKAAVGHLSGIDLLRRDYKSSTLSIQGLGDKAAQIFGGQGSHDLRAGFSSVNLGLPTWLHRSQGQGTANEAESASAWKAFWNTLREWMAQQKLDVAVVGTSFRGEEDGKHRRELLLAFGSRSATAGAEAERFFQRVRDELERDATLDLVSPWKGARLASTGKKERVAGWSSSTGRLDDGERATWAAVWKQGNARANRKVYLSTIMSALQKAMGR